MKLKGIFKRITDAYVLEILQVEDGTVLIEDYTKVIIEVLVRQKNKENSLCVTKDGSCLNHMAVVIFNLPQKQQLILEISQRLVGRLERLLLFISEQDHIAKKHARLILVLFP